MKNNPIRLSVVFAFLMYSGSPLQAAGTVTHISKTSLVAASDTANRESAVNTLGFNSSVNTLLNSISDDGRYGVFTSRASNLVASQAPNPGNYSNVFIHDFQTGITRLVSHVGDEVTGGNRDSGGPVISADGSAVVFVSEAGTLGFTKANARTDVVHYDVATRVLTLVSRSPTDSNRTLNDASGLPSISANGDLVAFGTLADDHGFTDNNPQPAVFKSRRDILLLNMNTNALSLVSRSGASATTTGNNTVNTAWISANGNAVVFSTNATDMGVVDNNSSLDVFRYNVGAGDLTLISRAAASPTQTGNGSSSTTAGNVSADGSVVTFSSSSTDLGFTDTNGFLPDVFMYTAAGGGTLTLVSHSAASLTTTANDTSSLPVLSRDGLSVAFESRATDLGFVDNNNATDVFHFSILNSAVTLLSHGAASTTQTANDESRQPVISNSSNQIAFETRATDMGFTDGNGARDVVLHTLGAGNTLASSSAGGGATANGESRDPLIAGNGSRVLFNSAATDLQAGVNDANNAGDLVAYTPSSGGNQMVSRTFIANPPIAANGQSTARGNEVEFFGEVDNYRNVSADGRYSVFTSTATNIADAQSDNNSQTDVFIHDAQTDAVQLLSHTGDGVSAGNSSSYDPVISADGSVVVFTSMATNLGFTDSNGSGTNGEDVFLYTVATGDLTLVSRAIGSSTQTANSRSANAFVSDDGNRVVFESAAGNLIDDFADNNFVHPQFADIYLLNISSGVMTLVSHAAGSMTESGNGRASEAIISGAGNQVVFQSDAGDLVAGQVESDRSIDRDVFVHDVASGVNSLVSHSSAGVATEANFSSRNPSISADGSLIAFQTNATDLGFADFGGRTDTLYLYDVATAGFSVISHEPGDPDLVSGGSSVQPAISADGSAVVFTSSDTGLVDGLMPNSFANQLYHFDVATAQIRLVSHIPSDPLATGNGIAVNPAISANGQRVAFQSESTNYGFTDNNGGYDTFLYTLDGPVSLLSHVQGDETTAGDDVSTGVSINAAGDVVVFNSLATNLSATVDNNGVSDVFRTEINIPIDSDGDGITDDYETANGLDPNDDGSANPDNGAAGDPDGDGFTNIEEFNAGTAANNPDTDGDGLGDAIDAEPATTSNACIQDGNGDADFNFTAMSGMLTQCAADNSITLLDAANAVIEAGATLQLYSLTVSFREGAVVPQGAEVQTIIGDPSPGGVP